MVELEWGLPLGTKLSTSVVITNIGVDLPLNQEYQSLPGLSVNGIGMRGDPSAKKASEFAGKRRKLWTKVYDTCNMLSDILAVNDDFHKNPTILMV